MHYLKMDQTSNFSIVEIQTELISHQLVNQFKTNLFIFGTNFLKNDYLLDNKNDRTRFVNVESHKKTNIRETLHVLSRLCSIEDAFFNLFNVFCVPYLSSYILLS